MPQFGSTNNLVSQNLSQTVDNQGNPIISSDTTFGASPLGYAARVQALFGLPNATFELTPPDTTLTINEGNQLPYWDVQEYSSGVMTATCVYDSTTNNWGIKLDPGTATTGDYLTMTTRSYLVNDDNLSLRQKALAVVSKNGTYAGATQWNLQLTASYYDATDTLLHSGTVATILDNTTWTSMAGTTTTGGTAINAAAHYVDLTYTLTATAPVTSATSVTIKSTLLQTSAGAAASQSFLVAETFTSSQTWTIPSGVTQLVAVVAVGGGGGGGGGMYVYANFSTGTALVSGGAGGGAGALYIAQGVPLSGTAVTISVGADGASGTAGTGFVSTSAGTTLNAVQIGGAGGAGGASSFGTQLTANGGGGGAGGSFYYSRSFGSNTPGTPAGGTGGTAATLIWGALTQSGTAGGRGAFAGSALSGNATAGSATGLAAYASVPYVALPGAGTAGGDATNTSGTAGGTATIYRPTLGTGAAGGASNFAGGGGGGGGGSANYRDDFATGASAVTTPAVGGNGGGGGGGGGGAWGGGRASSAGTFLAGNGGNAAPYSGGGGGGGGGLVFCKFSAGSVVTSKAGTGGSGASGAVYIWYVG